MRVREAYVDLIPLTLTLSHEGGGDRVIFRKLNAFVLVWGEAYMEVAGAYQAKTHLNQLLDRVAKGERIMITKHGVPVATLQPADPARKRPVREVIDQLKQFRGGHRLDGPSIREMIEEGRR